MTFATNDSRETATHNFGGIKTFGAAVLTRINSFRAERKALRSIYHYNSEKSARLEQAQRDVNRFWLGGSNFY